MKKISYEEAVKYINDIPKFTSKNKLSHTKKFLEILQIDQKKMKIIHVAGTNGKGTVCSLIANTLIKCDKSTGLFTSPHLVRINERVCINGEYVSDEEFLEAFLMVKEMTDEMYSFDMPHPSYFEFLFLMAMWIFDKRNVEYVVLETGLGGRLDATNSIDDALVTVITSIGLDHVEYLGDTISSIAMEKAGIIKKGVPVVFWGEDEEVCRVIERVACENDSKFLKITSESYEICKKTDKTIAFSSLCEYYLNDAFSVPFIAEYQVMNATLALAAISLIDDVKNRVEDIKDAFISVKWEGRMENVSDGIILDGAHNVPGINEFVKTFNEYKCLGKKKILFSVVKDKDYEQMISGIVNTDVDEVYVTGIDSDRGLNAQEIYNIFEEKGCKAKVELITNVEAAFKKAVSEKKKEDVLFCVGSLYLVGELKKIISE